MQASVSNESKGGETCGLAKMKEVMSIAETARYDEKGRPKRVFMKTLKEVVGLSDKILESKDPQCRP